MPSIFVRYSENRFRATGLRAIYEALARKVAVTADPTFGLGEIEYYAYANGLYSRASILSIEIETMAKPGRIERMNDQVESWTQLVREIREVALLKLPAGHALIWIKPVDPRGRHV